MPKISAGLLMYRIRQQTPQVLLVHPGGPFWRHKDESAWSIPKGQVESGEDLLATAEREFQEELGLKPTGPFIELHPIKQKGGKTVHAWAFLGDCDPTAIHCNLTRMEWPAKSGRLVEFPEVDRAEFFDPQTAKRKINPAQAAFIDELVDLLSKAGG
ncbi:MAG: NUDIX domain-containing protein [Bacillota bacterium]